MEPQDPVSAAEQIQGWMERDELLWLSQRASQSNTVVEIGCWKGRSTKALALSTPGKIYAIDPWEPYGCEEDVRQFLGRGWEGLHEDFLSNLKPEIDAGRVHVMRMRSVAAAALFVSEGRKADFVFIDGNHSYEAVRDDIQSWLPFLREGGIMAGHDYALDLPGVMKAVDELLPHPELPCGRIWAKKI